MSQNKTKTVISVKVKKTSTGNKAFIYKSDKAIGSQS